MIHNGPWYNPVRDIAAVEQNGYVDLVKCFQENMMPADIGGTDLEEDPCEDTDCVYPKAENVFDQMQQSYSIREALDNKSKPDESVG